jgi:hypothetical protein
MTYSVTGICAASGLESSRRNPLTLRAILGGEPRSLKAYFEEVNSKRMRLPQFPCDK